MTELDCSIYVPVTSILWQLVTSTSEESIASDIDIVLWFSNLEHKNGAKGIRTTGRLSRWRYTGFLFGRYSVEAKACMAGLCAPRLA
jgi:hypothetical protein